MQLFQTALRTEYSSIHSNTSVGIFKQTPDIEYSSIRDSTINKALECSARH